MKALAGCITLSCTLPTTRSLPAMEAGIAAISNAGAHPGNKAAARTIHALIILIVRTQMRQKIRNLG
ncbi:MAG: hypothetical protein KDA49_02305 [Rhodospirillaceae bacterium]|nr:hypothetical protein [Rhodospirillaceae bacterium]